MRVALSEVLGALSYALDITEGEPPGHAVRTTAIGMRLAEHLGLSQDERSALFYALLLKAAGCSSNASCLSSLFAAAEIARMLELPEDTAQAIRALDEHWDGGGQPLGLHCDEIPLFARMIDAKSPFTARHSAEVARWAGAVDALETAAAGGAAWVADVSRLGSDGDARVSPPVRRPA
jgi:HD-GYP domain-containing protein (c-di-GMP phosphodiesterase class II)